MELANTASLFTECVLLMKMNHVQDHLNIALSQNGMSGI